MILYCLAVGMTAEEERGAIVLSFRASLRFAPFGNAEYLVKSFLDRLGAGAQVKDAADAARIC